MANRRPTVQAHIDTFAVTLDVQETAQASGTQDVSRDRHRQIDGRSSTVPSPKPQGGSDGQREPVDLDELDWCVRIG